MLRIWKNMKAEDVIKNHMMKGEAGDPALYRRLK